MIRPRIIADDFIPFLIGRLDAVCDISYIHPDEITPEIVADADGLLIRTRTRCNAELLGKSKVRFIATGTIGMDQFDLPWCASQGIATFNSPGCNAPGVAQYVWSSLLHVGIDPRQSVIGVIGAGNVGRIVAEWGRHLGARVLLNDPPLEEELRLKGDPAANLYTSLDNLLSKADVVTLHTPLTRSGSHPSYHLISEREVSLIRSGSILVNAARGPVVDTEAIVRRAARGELRLITDCWEGEPASIDRQLLDLSEIATPHIAGYSLQGKQRATRMIVENAIRFFGLEGVKVDDLPSPYKPVDHITSREITESYNPFADTVMLRKDPGNFEYMRDHYNYRSEPASTLI